VSFQSGGFSFFPLFFLRVLKFTEPYYHLSCSYFSYVCLDAWRPTGIEVMMVIITIRKKDFIFNYVIFLLTD